MLFLTLTCPPYGRVTAEGTPADPDGYDYTAAARDALHFAALFDRFVQNLRRYCGHDLQYFAAIEPQRRLAPHVHMAIRGIVSRRELRRHLPPGMVALHANPASRATRTRLRDRHVYKSVYRPHARGRLSVREAASELGSGGGI